VEKKMFTIIDWAIIITAILTGLGVVFVLFELRHMSKHRDLEITMKLFEWAETESLRKAFRWVEKEFAFGSLEKYNRDVSKVFEVNDYPYQVESYFEELGFLVSKRFVDIDLIVDRLGSYIVSNWQRLEPWILAIRKEKADETFGEHFEMLYNKTLTCMKKNRYSRH
jgi:hypothetical protein